MAGNSVWAVGDAFDANGNATPYALRWNGRRWARVGVPAVAGGYFYSVTAAGHCEVIAVGIDYKGALSGLWNGRRWAVSTNPRITALFSLADDGRRVTWATGVSTQPRSDAWSYQRGLKWFVHTVQVSKAGEIEISF